MSKPGIMICMPLEDKTPEIPGSLPVKCADCPTLVSVSPSTWAILHDHPELKIVCPTCAHRYKTEESVVSLASLTPSQIADLCALLNEGE